MIVTNDKRGPILVTGAAGMLGTDLVEEILKQLGEGSVIPTTHQDLDITDLKAVERFFEQNSIGCVINAAAYTDVDGAEVEREKAYLVNSIGPKNLTTIANSKGISVIHFSTDYVFDGSGRTPLTEEDIPSPPKPNYYGETKLMGEKEVLRNPLNLVLRVQWLYGKRRERFTGLKLKETFNPFVDQWGAPTWTRDVSRTVLELVDREARGLFNFAYDDFTTWFEVFSFVKRELNISTELVPKKISEVNLPALRPRYGAMSNKKLLRHLGKESMGSWKTSLHEFLKESLDCQH